MPRAIDGDELRAMIREECRAAVREELLSIMATAVNATVAAAQVEGPVWWGMDMPQLARAIEEADGQAEVLEIMAAEKSRPDGARPNVILAARVRIQELDEADSMALGS